MTALLTPLVTTALLMLAVAIGAVLTALTTARERDRHRTGWE